MIAGISLGVVLMLAKWLGIGRYDLLSDPWLLLGVFTDDLMAGLVLGAATVALKRPRLTWTIYALVVVWAAINVPVVRALSSPLTLNMIAAAGGPLRDSIAHYATAANVGAMLAVLSAGVAVPLLVGRLRVRCRITNDFRNGRSSDRPKWADLKVGPSISAISKRALRRSRRLTIVAVAVGVLIAAAGAGERIDLDGRERNALTRLAWSAMPRIRASGNLAGDLRESPFASESRADLSFLRGAARGRHVVLVILESTAAEYLRSYGAVDDPTPHLTRFAENAIRFERAYVAYPESVKGLVAVLCSKWPAFDVSVEAHARAACPSLAGTLRQAGYRTALFHSGRFAYLGMNELVASMEFDVREDAGTIGGNIESSFGVDDGATVDRMLTWIDDARDDRPFVLTYLPTAGHHPYATSEPGPFDGDDEFAAYRNALHEGDRALGKLFQGLDARGLLDETLVVVTADHGEAFGQHANAGHSLQIYDENIRVPLLLSIPGITVDQTSIPDVASTIDVAPTVLELLGLSAPSTYEGSTLLGGEARIAFFYTDYAVGLLGLQDGCWKYHFDIEASRSRLFNTCGDPGERIDQADRQVARVAEYRRLVSGWSSTVRGRF